MTREHATQIMLAALDSNNADLLFAQKLATALHAIGLLKLAADPRETNSLISTLHKNPQLLHKYTENKSQP